MKTTIGIIGAGPAGLLLAHLLHLEGIDSVVLEARSRDYVERRVRAGVLEQGTVDLLRQSGVGGRMNREGLEHHGIWLRFRNRSHHLDFPQLTGGNTITVYGQQEVVKDLIEARLLAGGRIEFEATVTGIEGISGSAPRIIYRQQGEERQLDCHFIAGCDGFHGVSRTAIPADVLSVFDHVYPYAWLGILAEAAPFSADLIYASHERGFALHSMRTPTLSRNYIQCNPQDDIGDWSDERIWDEFTQRMESADGLPVQTGEILEKGITTMRSFVAEPMQHGRLFLAGDAAHIVPPTGAKGMNLAVADVKALAAAFTRHYSDGDEAPLAGYSAGRLKHVWRAQHFSWWMTSMLHLPPDGDAYARHLQLSQLEHVCSSETAARDLAENYVGLAYH